MVLIEEERERDDVGVVGKRRVAREGLGFGIV
jgi:hypothetical protein